MNLIYEHYQKGWIYSRGSDIISMDRISGMPPLSDLSDGITKGVAIYAETNIRQSL